MKRQEAIKAIWQKREHALVTEADPRHAVVRRWLLWMMMVMMSFATRVSYADGEVTEHEMWRMHKLVVDQREANVQWSLKRLKALKQDSSTSQSEKTKDPPAAGDPMFSP